MLSVRRKKKTMGKPDVRQPTLAFEKRNTRHREETQDTQTIVPETQMEPDSDFQTIVKEVKTCLHEIDSKIDTLAARIDRISRKVDTHDARITTLETRVSDIEDSQQETRDNLSYLNKTLEAVKAKNEELEGRSRRNNIRLTGIPESTNIPNMELFVEGLLTELFGEHLSNMFLIERAHRTLGPRPKPGLPPHPILARLLNYRDRDAVLGAARERGELIYQNNPISIYPDFTQAVQAARKEFLPAKKIFRTLGSKYAMLYPAKLRVHANGKQLLFVDAKAAMKFAKEHSKQQRGSPERNRSQLSDTG